jgi:hypothetical protein
MTMSPPIYFLTYLCFIPFVFPEWIYAVACLGITLLAAVTISLSRKISQSAVGVFVVISLLAAPSFLLNPAPQLFISYAIYIFPLIPWLLVGLRPAVIRAYSAAFRAGVLTIVIGVFLQVFIDPGLFGFAKHSVYTGDLFGTTSFRPTGLAGSPQNVALLLGIGMFLIYSKSWYVNVIIKLAIAFAGMQTLATFFGGALLTYFIFKARWYAVFCVACIVATTWSLDFSNSVLEFMSFRELQSADSRFDIEFISEGGPSLIFGHGVGSATQGVLDRGFVYASSYQSESFILTTLFEFGMVALFFGFSFYVLLVSRTLKGKLNWAGKGGGSARFFSILFLVVVSAAVTPNLSSFRMKVLLIPILLIPLIYSRSPDAGRIFSGER